MDVTQPLRKSTIIDLTGSSTRITRSGAVLASSRIKQPGQSGKVFSMKAKMMDGAGGTDGEGGISGKMQDRSAVTSVTASTGALSLRKRNIVAACRSSRLDGDRFREGSSTSHFEAGSRAPTAFASDTPPSAKNSKQSPPPTRSFAASATPSGMRKPPGTDNKIHQRSSSVVPAPSLTTALKSSTASIRDALQRSNRVSMSTESPVMINSTPLAARSTTTGSKVSGKTALPIPSPSSTVNKRMNGEVTGTAGKQSVPSHGGQGVQTRKMARTSSTRVQGQVSEAASASATGAIQKSSPLKPLVATKSKPKSTKSAGDQQSGSHGSNVIKSPRARMRGSPLGVFVKDTPRSGKPGFNAASATAATPTQNRATSRIPRPDPRRQSMAPSLSTPRAAKGTPMTSSLQRQALGKSLYVKPTRKLSLLPDRELGMSTPLRPSGAKCIDQQLLDPLLDNLDVHEPINSGTLPPVFLVEDLAACSLEAGSGRSAANNEQDEVVRNVSPVETEEKSVQEFSENDVDEIDAFAGKTVHVDDAAPSSSKMEPSLLIDIQRYQLELESLKLERKEMTVRLEESLQLSAHAASERRRVAATKLFTDLATACQVELDHLQQERKNRAGRAAVLGEAIQLLLIGHSETMAATGEIVCE
ncbi:hypothetical protein QFC21_004357 [Naganishia friedmannii]|uniref:Uncharacterized protein n=1 Tax=Naganishia friedmannii TaxID=89922 RepID=A0ACC2VH30_9TREE|nr:hypothetical protein QFC21_004357 [Naganishia friedmannii]